MIQRPFRLFLAFFILSLGFAPVAFAKPSIGTVAYPSNLAAGTPVTLSASVSSGVAISSCNLYVDSADEGAMTVSGGTASKSYAFPYARVYTVFVFCRDASGGMASGPNTSIFVKIGATGSSDPFGGSGNGSETPIPPATPSPEQTATSTVISAGTLIKLGCPESAAADHPCKAVYYYGSDGKRHAFPNEKIYFTWYADFANVVTLSSDEMGAIALGKNVTYRPGVKMVKFTTLNNVYAVAKGGVLRWVTSEALATALYGAEWNTKIDDISDAYFSNYQFGADVASAEEYVPASEQNAVPTIDAN